MAGSGMDISDLAMSENLLPLSQELVADFTMTSPADNISDPYWDKIPFAHPYWKQFDIAAIPDYYHYIVAVWMTFFGIMGTLGNFLVIYIFLTTKHLRNPPNMLVVNLALSDMTFSAVNGFPLLTIASINKIWTWGHTLCKIYAFVGAIMGLASINTLAVIALDRYLVISSPLQAARNMTKRRSFTLVLLIWAWSSLWSVPPLFGWGSYVPEGFHTSCTFDYLTQTFNNLTFNAGMYIGSFVIPVCVIICSYVGIVKAIFKHHEEMAQTASKMGAQMTKADNDRKSEFKTAKVAATSIAAFMLSWTPYAIVGLIGLIFPHEYKIVTPLMSEIPVMFAKASASWNPVIYAISHPKYRAEINKRMPWVLACCGFDEEQAKGKRPTGAPQSSISKTESCDTTMEPTGHVTNPNA